MDRIHFLAQPKKDNNQFKNKINKDCQKVELYGNMIMKELKKKHSSRLVGGAETTHSKAVAGGQCSPTITCG